MFRQQLWSTVYISIAIAALLVSGPLACTDTPDDGSLATFVDSGDDTDAGYPKDAPRTDTPYPADGGPDASDAANDASADSGENPASLDNKLADFIASAQLPGAVAIVFNNQRVIARGAAGKRKSGGDKAVTFEDRFHLGSCTKAMTATLVARLVDSTDLGWSKTLPELLPSISGEMHEAYSDVTLTETVRHKAGLPASLANQRSNIWDYLWLQGDSSLKMTRKEVARRLLSDAPTETVGQFTYSNASYIVAGAAIETATGKTWETLMEQEIFEPLGMNSCGFGPPATEGTVDAPWGHTGAPGSYDPVAPGEPGADNPAGLGPAGTVHCNLRDWLKFARIHLGGGPSGFLADAKIDELQRPTDGSNPYAGGWYVVPRTWAGGDALNHTGSNATFFAIAWLAPERNLGFLVATNAAPSGVASDLNGLVADLISQYP